MNTKLAAAALLVFSFSPKIEALKALEKTYTDALLKSDRVYTEVYKKAEAEFRVTQDRDIFVSKYRNAREANVLSKKTAREVFQKGKKKILEGELKDFQSTSTSTPSTSL